MRLYDGLTPVETRLSDNAALMRIPFGGTMELTPLCNMNCKMCFIRQDPKEMAKQGRPLTYEEWLRIAEQMKESGVLCILITGGEPLTYPDFKKLYTSLTDMGFVITINTNGTLINEEMADFFAARPCRRLNITLYGRNDEDYERLCGNPKGHTQLMHALDLLAERKIPHRLNFSITPDNVDYLKEACEFAKSRDLGFEATPYMFPPVRRENSMFERLAPEEAGRAKADYIIHYYGEAEIRRNAKAQLKMLGQIKTLPGDEGKILCRAGKSGFWIDWTGHMLPCGMFTKPKYDLLTMPFKEAWEHIVCDMERMRMHTGCSNCDKKSVCTVCAAACLCENTDITKRPDYVCRMTDSYLKVLMQYQE